MSDKAIKMGLAAGAGALLVLYLAPPSIGLSDAANGFANVKTDIAEKIMVGALLGALVIAHAGE